MKDFIKFIKSSGIYFFGNILTKLISFLLLPIYTKFINPTDYGTYDLMIAYITFFTSVLFLDIWSGIMRFMFDYDKVYLLEVQFLLFLQHYIQYQYLSLVDL